MKFYPPVKGENRAQMDANMQAMANKSGQPVWTGFCGSTYVVNPQDETAANLVVEEGSGPLGAMGPCPS